MLRNLGDSEKQTIENIDNYLGIDAYENRKGMFLVETDDYEEAYRQLEEHDKQENLESSIILSNKVIVERTTDSTAKAFTPEQRQTILPALKELGAEKLFAAANEDEKMKRICNAWKEDTLRELKDLEKGIIREEGQGIRR